MTRRFAIATLVFALAGFGFASVSTYDFAAHLDRQVHGIHCSLLPGAQAATTESSGCATALMSPYSSVLRTQVWGGIPIALPGMAVFAFLAFYASYLLASGAHRERRPTAFGALAWSVPILTSCVMAYLAIAELEAVCTLCAGIYASSACGLVAAALLHRAVRTGSVADSDATLVSAPPIMTQPGEVGFRPPPAPPASVGPGRSVLWALPLAAVFVALPVASYVAAMPSYSAYEAGCGDLSQPEDRYDVLVPLGGSVQGRTTIEVLDPLCASCKALEGRLAASGLDERLYRKALLFPLDDECNWMVSSALHPGACAVSEALLCQPNHASEILEWSFENQQTIMQAERARDGAAAQMVTAQFPATRGCVGSTRIRSQLHRGLRWAVANQLPVLTPQLFVEGRKLCNEDTDLGLEYMLSRILEQPVATTRPGAAP